MLKRGKEQLELITGLDIGSSAIRIAVGQQTMNLGGRSDLQIIGLVQVPSEGVHKGAVTSIEETVSSISHALEQVEHQIGVPIEHAWVSLCSLSIICQESKGVVAVAKSDGEIGPEDVQRAVEAAQMVATPLNYEILHVLPRAFTVDNQTGIKDPVGMTGIRLEVETKIIQGVTSNIKNITKAVYRTGIDIDDLVLSILAAGELVATPRQKDLGVAVVNMGGATTSMVVYEEGDIIHLAVLPVGSGHVTNDLAIGLRTPIDIAERVKVNCGQCVSKGIHKRETVDLADFGAELSEEASRKYIAEIIEARMEEILGKINKELVAIGRSGLLPAGVIFTGGGAKISGLVDLAKDKLRLPASLGYPFDLRGLNEKINDLSFSAAIGLVKWGSSVLQGGKRRIGISSQFKNIDKVSRRVKEWFKSLIP